MPMMPTMSMRAAQHDLNLEREKFNNKNTPIANNTFQRLFNDNSAQQLGSLGQGDTLMKAINSNPSLVQNLNQAELIYRNSKDYINNSRENNNNRVTPVMFVSKD